MDGRTTRPMDPEWYRTPQPREPTAVGACCQAWRKVNVCSIQSWSGCRLVFEIISRGRSRGRITLGRARLSQPQRA
jgi:hypothetical protein